MKFLRNTSWFTLVEMVLATTIFAIMSLMVMSVYIQTTALTSKLKATRYLSETAREITERIAEDVKERGLSGSVAAPGNSPYWDSAEWYMWDGKEILGIWDGNRVYIYGKKVGAWINPCTPADQAKATIHCGLYMVNNFNSGTPGYSDAWNLVDSFIPEEGKKRVKIQNMKFYVSWDGISTERKVTLVFTLVLMPRIGVPNMDVSESKLKVQTTISERFFKQN
jgi:hypothetical protein